MKYEEKKNDRFPSHILNSFPSHLPIHAVSDDLIDLPTPFRAQSRPAQILLACLLAL